MTGTKAWRRALSIVVIVLLLFGLVPAALAEPSGNPLDTWDSVPGWTTTINDVIYANGGYVAVGASGKILTSDGVGLVEQDSGSGNDLFGVAFGNGRYVAVGYYGTILISTNATDWTTHVPDGNDTAIPNSYLYSVEFINNRFVAVGEGAVILTSPDGLAWTRQTGIPESTGESLHGVAFGNGTYVAVGEYSVALTSTNGQNWTRRITGVAARDVVYAGGRFVVVGENGDTATSTDGVTWAEAPGSASSLFGICYAAGTYVAVGADGTIHTSTNGINWTSHNSGTMNSLFAVAYADGVFTAVGVNGTILRSGNVPHITRVVAGELFAHAIRSDGTVWGWGANSYGQLCNGSNDDNYLPVEVGNLAGLTKLAGAFGNGYAVKPDGTVISWGMNYEGGLGNNSTTDTTSNVPVAVSTLTGITDVFGGYETAYALTDAHTLWSWGWGEYGELGNGTSVDSNVPVPIPGLADITAVAGGWWNGYALHADGTVSTWGANYQGQLGSDQSSDTLWYVPQPIPTLSNVTALAAKGFSAYALKSDGTVWAWGNNDYGQVGDAPITGAFAPVQVGGLSDITAITSGHFSAYALRSDGTVWAWGGNTYGQLGNGSTTDSSVPVQVTGLADIAAISAGQFCCYALGSDDTVWAWGDGLRGQLGNGSTTNSSVPVQVGIPAATYAAPSSDANLDGLALPAGIVTPLTPAFSSDVTSYIAVANESIQVLPTTDANAIITVNGSTVTSGDWSQAITLTPGQNIIEVVVTAEDGVTTKTYTITVATGLVIQTPPTLPGGIVGELYGATLESTGGFGPYTWSVDLPPGLALNSATGEITGTPTAPDHYDLWVTVTDIRGLSASKIMEIDITDPSEGDTTPPVWAPTYPHAEKIGDLRCWLGVQGIEAGTAYWVVLPDGASAPSAWQVAHGQNYDGDPVPNGQRAFIATGESITRITGLLPDVDYDIYIVAVDQAGNWQAVPTLVEVHTQYPDDGLSGLTGQQMGPSGSKRVTLTVAVKAVDGTTCPGHLAGDFTAYVAGGQICLGEDPHFSSFVDNDDGTYTVIFTGDSDGTAYEFSELRVGDTIIDEGPITVTTPPMAVVPQPYVPPQTPPTPQAQLLDSNGNAYGTVPVAIFNGAATVTIDQGVLSGAFAASSGDARGVTKVEVSIPAVSGATAYELTLPIGFLSSGDATKVLQVQTAIGWVTVPGNLLASGTTGSASIVIATGDRSKLDPAVQAQVGDRPVVDLSLKVNGVTTPWSNNGAPVQVSIPYTPTAAELADPDHITVWYIDGSGNAVAVPSGRYDATTGSVMLTVTHFSDYAVVYVEKTFTDLTGYGWAQQPIEALAAKGVIRGVTNDSFFPAGNITRVDFLVLLVRTLGLTASIDGNFSDVYPQDYYYEAIGTAKKLGIANGIGDNLFSPGDAISRQDMGVLTARALGYLKLLQSGTSGTLAGFRDSATVSEYAVPSLASLVKAGLLNGADGAFSPLAPTTRAEAAALLYRIYTQYLH